MVLKTVHASDLSGRYRSQESAWPPGRSGHPDFASGEPPVELEVLPDEVKKLAGEESQFVSLDYYAPGERSPARLVIRIEELDELAHNGGMADVLRSAIGVRHSASGAEDGHAQNEAGNGGSGSTTQALSMQVSPPGSDN